MKKSQNGFIAPLLIAIIAILIIVVGIYIYHSKTNYNQQSNNLENTQNNAQVTDSNDISSFAGLPKIEETEKVKVSINETLVSQDKTQSIVTIITEDKTQPIEEGMGGGGYPVVKSEEFVCNVASRMCKTSAILSSARKTNKDAQCPLVWDTAQTLVYMHHCEPGADNTIPLIAYNYSTNSTQKTILSNSDKSYYVIREEFFSPSLKKVFVLNLMDSGTNKQGLDLFATSDLSKVIKTVNLSAITNINDLYADGSPKIVWSQDENQITLGTKDHNYLVNLITGTLNQQ